MKKLTLLFMLVLSMSMFAQEFPEVTIEDIQFLPDSVLQADGDGPSPMVGDTVIITGVALVSTVVDPQTDRRPIISAGGRWVTYIEDQQGNVWGGMNVVQHDTTGDNQLTFFQNVDSADVVQVIGIVEEYYTSTQFSVLINPLTEVQVIDQLDARPAAIELEISDFMQEGVKVADAEKYEGMRVVIREGITSERSSSSGTFKVTDADGNYIWMYDQSGYYTKRGHRLSGLTEYEPPLDGSSIVKFEGIVTTRDETIYLVPVYPGDLEWEFEAPNISTLGRDVAFAGRNENVTINTEIFDANGTVSEAWLMYSVDGAAYDSVQMSLQADTEYSADIPGVDMEEATVRYFVKAVDNDGNSSFNPQDTSSARYFYLVREADPTIQDIQYSPFGSGYSSANGFEVTVQGVVTGDYDDYGSYIYIQNGQGAWSGIRVLGAETENAVKGDLVEVTGAVNENYGVTVIGTVEQGATVNVVSSGNALPEPEVVTTGSFSQTPDGTVEAEQWESVLIKFENLLVAAANADGSSNFGEILVDDNTGGARVELQDGNVTYWNGYDNPPADSILVQTGDNFDSITGIMYYSFSNYKLIPRSNDDFTGFSSDVEEVSSVVPERFEVSQNYPNPFNPTTNILFSLPEASNVKVVVYDMLGREVAELFNGYKNAGSYNITFNASSLASGVYVYRVEAGKFNAVKKMILMK